MAKAGRPSDYRAAYAELARNYCLLGATEAELGAFFGVSDRTIRTWKKTYPKFAQAIEEGTVHPNARVIGSLYKQCIAGNVTAIIWWTKNKMGWRDRTDVVAKVGISPVDELLSDIEGTSFKPKAGD